MKKSCVILIFLAAVMFQAGCVKDDESLCKQLVAFTTDCYQQLIGRPPSSTEVSQWRDSCEADAHSAACLNCAMEQSCDDYLFNHEYVYNDLCFNVCP